MQIEIFKNNAGVMELVHTLLHPTIDGNPVGGVMSLAVGDFASEGIAGSEGFASQASGVVIATMPVKKQE